jgi:ketosteroid isomerase-like protein
VTAPQSTAGVEAQIRARIDERANAVRARDVNGAMATIAPDIISFDVVNPLHYRGVDAARKRTEEWFSSFQGPLGYEMRDLRITAGEDVAVAHSLNHYSGTTIDGGTLDRWVRATVCYRTSEGTWLITHEHSSVPFDPASGRAALDLQPYDVTHGVASARAHIPPVRRVGRWLAVRQWGRWRIPANVPTRSAA